MRCFLRFSVVSSISQCLYLHSYLAAWKSRIFVLKQIVKITIRYISISNIHLCWSSSAYDNCLHNAKLDKKQNANYQMFSLIHHSFIHFILNQTRSPCIHTDKLTSLPKVIWEEGRVEVLSHTYAVKSPLVTMVCPKFAPKSTHSRGSIPKPHYLPHPWTRPTYDAKRHPDPIRCFSKIHWTDRPTDRSSTGKFDDYSPIRL